MEARSPYFESQVYKSYALQKIKKVLRLEGAKLTYRKDECDDAEEGRMRLTAQSTVTATVNMHRKRQGFKVKTGRKTWAFEVRQLDKHADLWVKEIQQSINRIKAKEAAGITSPKERETSMEKTNIKIPERVIKPTRPMVSVAVDGQIYSLCARKTKSVQVETKNWGKVNFALDERYKKLDYLGEGSYGVVIATEDTTDKDIKIAVKGVIGLFSGSNSHLDPIRKIAREVRISRQVDHPHVIKLIDAYVPPVAEFDHVYLMFEHMDKSLWKVAYGKYDLAPVQIQWLMYQLVCGIHYLHSLGVMHRDLAPTNVLVNKTLELKICDLGFARTTATIGPNDIGLSREAVTQYWRAPEVELSVGGYTKAIDMWAIGVIFADMLAKRPILHSKSVKELLTKQIALVGKPDDETIERVATVNYNRQHKYFLQRMDAPAQPYDLSKLFSTPANDAERSLWAAGLDLVSKLLLFDPEKRLTAAEAMAHPFFDEHIKDFGPRTPEAEKPAEEEAYWGDIDSDEYTTLDSTARLACRRWILEDLVALHMDTLLESDEDEDEEELGSYTATEEETDVDETDSKPERQSNPTAGVRATGAGKVAKKMGNTQRGREERTQAQANSGFWSWLNYIVS
ncbi:cmgc mapk protein kinase [Nannochloropsis oceanica]